VIVDSVIHVDGRRAAEPHSLQETYEACREQRGLAWVGLHNPTKDELNCVAGEFGLDPLAWRTRLRLTRDLA
jgi:magnesium transporter